MDRNKQDAFVKDRVLTYLKKSHDYGNSYMNALSEYGNIAFEIVGGMKLDRARNLMHRNPYHKSIVVNF